jgi:small subunit ribosomal protein S8
MTDHLSNVLNSLKNGQKAGLKNVLLSGDVPQICIDVLNVLYKEGYIRGFQHVVSNNKKYISVFLKYTRTGQSVIKSITRVSKPGRRIYTSIKPL